MVRESLKSAKRIVIKVGSRVLLEENGRPNYALIAHLVEQIAALHKKKREVIFVTSGAIGAGMEALALKKRPKDLKTLQAAAAVGQVRLMRAYEDLFGGLSCMVGQVLLTHDDLKHRERHLTIRNTIEALLERNIIPIINENDTVAVDEIKFGDNDVLASLVAMLTESKALILLTTAQGFMIKKTNGDQELLPHIIEINEEVLSHIEAHQGGLSSGGMASKIKAAANMVHVGGVAVIASGNAQNAIDQIFEGENIGTVVGHISREQAQKMPGRKRWIAFYHKSSGSIVVDDGAKNAITKKGKSLLPVGVKSCSGNFLRGAVIEICDEKNVCFAKGICQVDGTLLNMIKGQDSKKLSEQGINVQEIVHRDNLAIINGVD